MEVESPVSLGHVIPSVSIVLLLFSLGGVLTDRARQRGNVNLDYDYEINSRWSSQTPSPSRQKPASVGTGSRTGGGGCPPEFTLNCTCEYRFDTQYDPNTKKQKFFVECRSSGFTNTSMLEYLPVETEVIDMKLFIKLRPFRWL